MQWADGFGGLGIETVEAYFRDPHPGSFLTADERDTVLGILPKMISEGRRIASENRPKKKSEGDG